MIPVFLGAGGRVVAPDLVGFGKSDKPKRDSAHSFTWHRQVLLEFVERMDLRNVVLVVQDWGGLLGLTLPMAAPDRYRGLLVMNTTLATGDAPLSLGFLAWREMCAKNPNFDVARLFARGNPHLSAAECAAYDAPFPDAGHRAALRAFPPMVPDRPEADGAAVSREAREFLRTRLAGPDLHGRRRAGSRPGRARDAGVAGADPQLPRAAGAAAGRALRAGARRGRGARGGGILPRVTPKRIYVYSPSSAVRNKEAVRRGIARLKALGHEVEADPGVFATHMRFAGDDEARLAGIARAAASGADIAIITRGGYGLTRLLPRLPYKAIAKAIDRGMQFVGLSDFTAFQHAVLAETGRVTWAGPAVGEDFGVEGEADEIMQACFEDLVNGQGEGTGWQLPKAEARPDPLQVKGTLWGGNLAMLTALVGTPWLPKVKGGILFLEDVSEHPYRVERMLTQLLHSRVRWTSRGPSCWGTSRTGCRCRTTRASACARSSTGCARR